MVLQRVLQHFASSKNIINTTTTTPYDGVQQQLQTANVVQAQQTQLINTTQQQVHSNPCGRCFLDMTGDLRETLASRPQDAANPASFPAQLVPLVTAVFQDWCKNKLPTTKPHPADGVKLCRFRSISEPKITLEEYMQRIHRYAECSETCFILCLIYLDRLRHRTLDAIVVDILSIHRLVITSIMLAAKFFDDRFYRNSLYGFVGGVSMIEMNQLECEMLSLLDFNLYVSPFEYYHYHENLCAFANERTWRSVRNPQTNLLFVLSPLSLSPTLTDSSTTSPISSTSSLSSATPMQEDTDIPSSMTPSPDTMMRSVDTTMRGAETPVAAANANANSNTNSSRAASFPFGPDASYSALNKDIRTINSTTQPHSAHFAQGNFAAMRAQQQQQRSFAHPYHNHNQQASFTTMQQPQSFLNSATSSPSLYASSISSASDISRSTSGTDLSTRTSMDCDTDLDTCLDRDLKVDSNGSVYHTTSSAFPAQTTSNVFPATANSSITIPAFGRQTSDPLMRMQQTCANQWTMNQAHHMRTQSCVPPPPQQQVYTMMQGGQQTTTQTTADGQQVFVSSFPGQLIENTRNNTNNNVCFSAANRVQQPQVVPGQIVVTYGQRM